jgi:hypothetical protein
MLVTSLVHSRLDYCNVVFAGLPMCDIRRLQSILNSSVRLVTGARKYDHVRSLLCDHHWLPIAERIEYKLCTLVFRCLQGNAPRYVADHVILMSSVGRRRGLRSVDTLTLVVPRTHLSFGDRAFSVAGPRAWNSLPLHVRSAQSMYTCRKLLKTYLFQRVYLRFYSCFMLGVLAAVFAYVAVNLSFLHYIYITAQNIVFQCLMHKLLYIYYITGFKISEFITCSTCRLLTILLISFLGFDVH